MTDNFLNLPIPTNRVRIGPRIKFEGRQLNVEYDFELDNGGSKWSTILFDDVLQFEFREQPFCAADDIVESTNIRISKNTVRYKKTIAQWCEMIGWQEWQQKQGGADRFSQFTIYFDDVGCLEVIAADCRLNFAE